MERFLISNVIKDLVGQGVSQSIATTCANEAMRGNSGKILRSKDKYLALYKEAAFMASKTYGQKVRK